MFETIEAVCIACFTLEYFLRLMTVGSMSYLELGIVHLESGSRIKNSIRKMWWFVTFPMNLIDLLAILPFYLGLFNTGGSGSLANLRVLRLTRVFRIFKLGKYSEALQMFIRVLKESGPALFLMGFFLTVAVIVFGSLIYYIERGTFNAETRRWERCSQLTCDVKQESPFKSIPEAFWWVIVTSTTVGYGDMYPTTVWGKICGSCTMIVGVLVLALPISIIGSNFQVEYEKKRQQRREELEQRFNRKAICADNGLPLNGGEPQLISWKLHDMEEEESQLGLQLQSKFGEILREPNAPALPNQPDDCSTNVQPLHASSSNTEQELGRLLMQIRTGLERAEVLFEQMRTEKRMHQQEK
jgi:hypothetical protein